MQLDAGEISIGENGVSRNCIGCVLYEDMPEKLLLVIDRVNAVATRTANEEEIEKELASFRATHAQPASQEELAEMRAPLANGTQIVDVITGSGIILRQAEYHPRLSTMGLT